MFSAGEENMSPASRDDLTEFVIAVSVWPKFRDLVAHMMAQGSTTFPALPVKPDKIVIDRQKRVPKEDKASK